MTGWQTLGFGAGLFTAGALLAAYVLLLDKHGKQRLTRAADRERADLERRARTPFAPATEAAITEALDVANETPHLRLVSRAAGGAAGGAR